MGDSLDHVMVSPMGLLVGLVVVCALIGLVFIGVAAIEVIVEWARLRDQKRGRG